MQPPSHPLKKSSEVIGREQSNDPLMTSAEAKRLAGGVCDMTIYRWIKAGVIPPPLKIRGRNYWRRGEFVRSLESAADPTTTAA